MAGQDQDVIRKHGFQLAKRTQIQPERIAVRVDRPNADIRRDLRQHLVCRKEKLLRRRVEHYLFWRVAIARQHRERLVADFQRVAVNKPHECRRQVVDHLKIAVSLGGNERGGLRIKPVAQIEIAIGCGIQRTGTQGDVQASEIRCLTR